MTTAVRSPGAAVRPRPAVRGAVRGAAAYLLAPALGLVSGPVLGRALGPTGRGQFAAIMETLTVAGAFASLGVPAAVVYFIKQGHDPRRVYRLGLAVCLVPAGLVYGLLLAYAQVVSQEQHLHAGFLAVVWTAVMVQAVVQVRRAYWQSMSAWRRLDLERGGFAVARFLAVVGVAVVGVTTAGPYAVAALLAFVLTAGLLWVRPPPETLSDAGRPGAAALSAYSLSAALGTISIVANSRLDQVLLTATTSAHELGLYAVAVTVSEVPLVFGTLMARNALPLASSGGSLTALWHELRWYAAGLAVSTLALLALVGPAVPLVFGDDFSGAVGPSQLLLLGTFCTSVSLPAVAIVSGRGWPFLSSLIPTAGLGVTIAAYALCWGEVSAWRAAVISTVSALACAGTAVVLVRRPMRART
jgi:O-antigen/teichoic acid export membrane protein